MNLLNKILHINQKSKIEEKIPNHFEEILSQYSTFPRFYYINQKKYDIDTAESIKQIPLCKTEFIINGEIWGIDGILRSHVNRFYHKFPEKTRAACYEKIAQYNDSPYFAESPDEKYDRLKQAEILATEKEKLEKISSIDMNKFNIDQFVFEDIFYDYRMARMLINAINQATVLKDIEFMNSFIERAVTLANLKLPYKSPVENISFSKEVLGIANETYTQYYSFFECTPYTPTGKDAKFPLVLHFATSNAYSINADNKYHGEIYYMQNGSIGKARLVCWIHSYLCVVNLSIIQNELDIKSVETTNNGTKKTLYKH